jgi:Polysulphide reductase, NrfD
MDLAGGRTAEPAVRHSRYLAMLAPTVGSLGLILNLHTPKRFYNMLRLIKTTSPMSLGSWALVGFGITGAVTAASQWVADRSDSSWLRRAVRVTQVLAALAGVFMGTYTASLLSATSTPSWAAAPRSLAIPYASSAVASRRRRPWGWASGMPADGGIWTASPLRRSRWRSPQHSLPNTQNSRQVSTTAQASGSACSCATSSPGLAPGLEIVLHGQWRAPGRSRRHVIRSKGCGLGEPLVRRLLELDSDVLNGKSGNSPSEDAWKQQRRQHEHNRRPRRSTFSSDAVRHHLSQWSACLISEIRR